MKKYILLCAVMVTYLMPVSLYALKGTAVRRIINYTPENIFLMGSNGVVVKQGGATVNQYGVLIPSQTDFYGSNDPEIKQDPKEPMVVEVDMNKQRYLLSDYDWRIWLVLGGERTNIMLYDKQYLKNQYKRYRTEAALASIGVLTDTLTAAASGKFKLSLGSLASLADKPPTKDVRLYIMPDSSLIFTPNYEDESETPPDIIIKDLVAHYQGDPEQDYRFLYGRILDELLRTDAYREALVEALEGMN